MSVKIPLRLSSLVARFSDENEQAFFEAWHSVLDNAESLATDAITQSGINLKTGGLARKIDYDILSPTEAEFSFDSSYAGYLDDGFDGFDMIPGILKSPKAKVSKDGFKYARIPIEGQVRTVSEKPWTQRKRSSTGQFTKGSKWQHPGVKGYQFSKILQDSVVKKVEHELSELDFEEEDNLRLEEQADLMEDDEDFFAEIEDLTGVSDGMVLSAGFLSNWSALSELENQME